MAQFQTSSEKGLVDCWDSVLNAITNSDCYNNNIMITYTCKQGQWNWDCPNAPDNYGRALHYVIFHVTVTTMTYGFGVHSTVYGALQSRYVQFFNWLNFSEVMACVQNLAQIKKNAQGSEFGSKSYKENKNSHYKKQKGLLQLRNTSSIDLNCPSLTLSIDFYIWWWNSSLIAGSRPNDKQW